MLVVLGSTALVAWAYSATELARVGLSRLRRPMTWAVIKVGEQVGLKALPVAEDVSAYSAGEGTVEVVATVEGRQGNAGLTSRCTSPASSRWQRCCRQARGHRRN